MGELTQRLFLGVAVDDEVRHHLASSLDALEDPLPGSTVPPENWHVTLRFLGAATQVQRERVLGSIHEGLDAREFSIRFDGLGAFPRSPRASVLFVGIEDGAAGLAMLADVCEEAAIDAGFDPEGRPFHPHLTLARIRPPQDVTSLIERFGVLGARQVVARVVLYVSHVGRGGARYAVIERIPLLS